MDQASRNGGDIVDSCKECGLICDRRFCEAADFPDELERSGTNFFGSDRRIKIEKRSDVSTHWLCTSRE